MTALTVRDYRTTDEDSWLRCRVLGFLDTSYFDDVWPTRPDPEGGMALVIPSGEEVVAICDASVWEGSVTIDTIVVHPDHRRNGLATMLLDELGKRCLTRGIRTLEAWTRDDPGTHAWYIASGFTSVYRYLHVYASGATEMAAAGSYGSGLIPRAGHFHADTSDPREEELIRARFERVHACHRFVREL